MSGEALALVSRLLQYPDDAFKAELAQMQTVAERLAPGPLADAVRRFLEYVRSQSAIALQEHYTAAFDIAPATTLNLTYHAYGDTEQRAAALARLARTYATAGWSPATGELPDYLPLMLEFLSLCPAADPSGPVRQALEGLGPYIERLAPSAPEYAALIAPLAEAFAPDRGIDDGGEPPPQSGL